MPHPIPASADAQLRKTIGSLQLFSLAFGAILGAGWIIALGQWLATAGPVGTTIGFFAGSGVLSLIALCYAQLGARYPAAGGEVVYAGTLFGERAAYYTGWFLAITYIGACAFEAISLGWVFEALLPQLQGPVAYRVLDTDVHLGGLAVGLASVVAAAWVNARGARATTTVQDGLTLALIVAALVFVGAGFAAGHAHNLEPQFVLDRAARPWTGILAIFVTAPFWFSGFGVVAQALGETAETARRGRLSLILLAAINASCLFYVLVMLAASVAVPRQALLAMPLPAAGAFVSALHSALLGKLVLFTGLLGLLIALNAIFYSATRVLYSLATAGQIPSQFGRIDPASGSPRAAVALVAGLSFLGTALGRGAIAPLIDSTAVALSGIYVMVCWGAARSSRADRDGFLWVARAATLFTLGMTASALVTPWLSPHRGLPTEYRLLIAALALGLLFRASRKPLPVVVKGA